MTRPVRPLGDPPDKVQQRIFRERGDNEYSLEILPAGIEFYLNRLHRKSQELVGELTVKLSNGHFPKAYTIQGTISSADFNISSATSRRSRAKLLRDRTGAEGESFDWDGYIEELSIKTITAEREGEPAVVLADFPTNPADTRTWELDGFPVFQRHPNVLLGRGQSAKSYLALWIAGRLASTGVSVLYLDWELTGDEHRMRLDAMFKPPPKNLYYMSCQTPLRDQMDRAKRMLAKHQCTFAVFDSVGPASSARGFIDADLGQEYFGLVRRFKIGSLHVAHPPKARDDDDKTATIYGSAFFDYLARSIWIVEAAETRPGATEIFVSLKHRKINLAAKYPDLAFHLTFTGCTHTTIERMDPGSVEEFVDKLPLVERLERQVRDGAMTIKALADNLDVPQATIRKTISRHKSKFARLDKNTVGLPAPAREMF